MATVGRIEEFNPEKERISAYLERVELFFIANGVEDAKQVATLLSVIGGKTYALLSDLLAPPGQTIVKKFETAAKDLTDSFRAETSGHSGKVPVPSKEPELWRICS